jgi:hypothetical protein
MRLDRNKLNVILPQIKAHQNIALLADNPTTPGAVDFYFQPKARDLELGYVNRLTCVIGCEDSLFGDGVVETLGEPITINIARLMDALKGGIADPELKEGAVNGISILMLSDESLTSILVGRLQSHRENTKNGQMPSGVEFVMPRIDYELMAQTVTPFVSQDTTRYFMNGYFVDLGKSEDFINFVATDGRRLSFCKFPCKHQKLGDEKGENGGFILKPLSLFIPKSEYSQVCWRVDEKTCLIRIQTEDYSIDCRATTIEGRFPSYPRVIPSREENSEWLNLSAASARKAFDSVKGLIDNSGYSSFKNKICINAEDPKSVSLTVPRASVVIDGEASRPMRIKCSWDILNSGFFETPYTRFMLKGADKAILAEEPSVIWGTTLSIIKVIMPMPFEDAVDAWGVPDALSSPPLPARGEIEDEDEDDEDDSSVVYGDSDDAGNGADND